MSNPQVIELLNEINIKLDTIETRLSNLEHSTTKMASHIDFVENVYDCVKHPLNVITNYISPSNEKSLLSIKNGE